MALIDPLADGPYKYGTRLELRIAGAESNFAIALSRLGIGVSWISGPSDYSRKVTALPRRPRCLSAGAIAVGGST